jgi:hypothetical protein
MLTASVRGKRTFIVHQNLWRQHVDLLLSGGVVNWPRNASRREKRGTGGAVPTRQFAV